MRLEPWSMGCHSSRDMLDTVSNTDSWSMHRVVQAYVQSTQDLIRNPSLPATCHTLQRRATGLAGTTGLGSPLTLFEYPGLSWRWLLASATAYSSWPVPFALVMVLFIHLGKCHTQAIRATRPSPPVVSPGYSTSLLREFSYAHIPPSCSCPGLSHPSRKRLEGCDSVVEGTG
jgi:hypothetical protein